MPGNPRTGTSESRETVISHDSPAVAVGCRFLERLPLQKSLELLRSLAPGLTRALYCWFYRYVSAVDRKAEATFLNFGYAELEPSAPQLVLKPGDESNRYCIQLYHALLSSVPVQNRRVLEIGCGRGGGAAYIARYLNPASVVGLDMVAEAVAFCAKHHQLPNLSFRQGDAQHLPFGSGSFDIVVNIESSHLYRSMARFLREVWRVLVSGGHFLLADFRKRRQVADLRQELLRAGFIIRSEQPITRNVLRALDLDSERRLGMIRRQVPRVMHKIFCQFAAVRGTSYYEAFRRGEREYLMFVLDKPPVRRPG